MKKFIFLVILLAGCKKNEVIPIENNNANSTNVVVIIGQSNADGNGTVSQFSSFLQGAQAGRKIFWKSDGNSVTNDGVWQDMSMGVNTQNPNGTQNDKGGIEAALSYRLKNTYGKSAHIIKAAWGGSSLGNTVAPTWKHTISGNLYDRMKNNYIAGALTQIPNPQIACVIWNQGETDATSSGFATSYETNLINLINKFRSDYGNVPFIIHRIKDLTAWGAGYWSQVRQAQINVANSLQGVYIINCDSYGFAGDNVHYTASSLESIGYDTSDKIIQINCLR